MIDFDKYMMGMKQVVDRQQQDKAQMDKLRVNDEEAGIKFVKAEDFDVINNRKKITHTQPFTDD